MIFSGHPTRSSMAPARFSIQPDWPDVDSAKDGKIWIGVGKSGDAKSTYFDVAAGPGGSFEAAGSCDFAFHRQSKQVLVLRNSSSDDRTVARFVAPRSVYARVHAGKAIQSVDVCSKGIGISAHDDFIKVWEMTSGNVMKSLQGHIGDVYCVKLLPSGLVVLSGGMDMQVRVWSAETGQCARAMKGHKQAILTVAPIGAGREVLSGSRDGSVKVWSCAAGQPTWTKDVGRGYVNCVASHNVSPQLTLCCTEGGRLAQYDTRVDESSDRGPIDNLSIDFPSALNTCSYAAQDHTVLCGAQNGTLHCVDVRNFSAPLWSDNFGCGAILCVKPFGDGYIFSTADGTVAHLESLANPRTAEEAPSYFTGSDCDPIYQFGIDGRELFTSCRDGLIRRYSVV